MKKVVIPLVIVVFGVCAFFGFKAASKILSSKDPASQQPTTSVDNLNVKQENFLFVHVNDLTVDKPELVSIWVGFVKESTPPELIVLSIFPTYNTEIHDRIKQSFGLDANNKLTRRFLNQIKSTFDFQFDGYVLTDDSASTVSNQWLYGVESLITSNTISTDEDKHALLLSEQTAWQQFCQLVGSGSANSYFSAINWGLLLPDHFTTDLDFESITLLTDRIIHATDQVKCEVLTSE